MGQGKEIIELFEATSGWMHDDRQRSALGIADSYARGSNSWASLTPKYKEDGLPEDRDALAISIIEIISDLDKDASYAARHEARDWLDAPYRSDPNLVAWRESRGGPIGGRSEK